jgi:hypothetical protein
VQTADLGVQKAVLGLKPKILTKQQKRKKKVEM